MPSPALIASKTVPTAHPYLFGSREELEKLARERPSAYARMGVFVRQEPGENHQQMVTNALVGCIDEDTKVARSAVDMAMAIINAPIRTGHTPFGSDMAYCAMVYDLSYDQWTAEERQAFFEYCQSTIDANIGEEPHVFHNGWYGYKNWGYGLAAYATWHENPGASKILKDLEDEYLERAVPALGFSGQGGVFGEGYYFNYWEFPWLVFCDAAQRLEGKDYYALSPGLWEHAGPAGMFTVYPGIRSNGSRRPATNGDAGGRFYHHNRDHVLTNRRILASHYRGDPAHQAVHTFNEITPQASSPHNAWLDFLWHDTSIPKADLSAYPLSHFSTGPGTVHARSSWEEDATWFYFRCGRRFTAHQHLDNGHFAICKYEELAGDGGHYCSFGGEHDINYHLRTIAHNNILIHDPREVWPNIRAGEVTANDGGQHHDWPHHNGACADLEDWKADQFLYETGHVTAYEDREDFLYTAGDYTGSYSPLKIEHIDRRIVFLRPDTFIVLDRARSARAEYNKTWLLQAMQIPEEKGDTCIITNGRGRLFVQTLLPEANARKLVCGDDQFEINGRSYPPEWKIEPSPACRIEVTPTQARKEDWFLHVLTAADADTDEVPSASIENDDKTIAVKLPEANIIFDREGYGLIVNLEGESIRLDPEPPALPDPTLY